MAFQFSLTRKRIHSLGAKPSPSVSLDPLHKFTVNKRGKPSSLSLNARVFLLMGLGMGCLLIDPAFGVTVEGLKAPVADLKDTIFGGWMWVPKIGAAVGGCLMAVYNQSIVPLATGAGIGLGIHFYDLYIKADGALI